MEGRVELDLKLPTSSKFIYFMMSSKHTLWHYHKIAQDNECGSEVCKMICTSSGRQITSVAASNYCY